MSGRESFEMRLSLGGPTQSEYRLSSTSSERVVGYSA